jgi:hypothetical protein
MAEPSMLPVSGFTYPADRRLPGSPSADDTLWFLEAYPQLAELPAFADPCNKAVYFSRPDTLDSRRLITKLELLRRLATTYGTTCLTAYVVQEPSQDVYHLAELLEPYCREIKWLSE